MQVYPEFRMPDDQLEAWKRDRAGCIVDAELARKHGWKIGDRVYIKGTIFPLNLDLTIRGTFTGSRPTETVYFNNTYLEESTRTSNSTLDAISVLSDSPAA